MKLVGSQLVLEESDLPLLLAAWMARQEEAAAKDGARPRPRRSKPGKHVDAT